MDLLTYPTLVDLPRSHIPQLGSHPLPAICVSKYWDCILIGNWELGAGNWDSGTGIRKAASITLVATTSDKYNLPSKGQSPEEKTDRRIIERGK